MDAALLALVLEAGADRLEDVLGVEHAHVGAVVDDEAGEEAGAELLVVLLLVLKYFVPLLVLGAGAEEGIVDAVLGLLPVEVESSVGVSGAVLGDLVVTLSVELGDVSPPPAFVRAGKQLLVKTVLTQVLKQNVGSGRIKILLVDRAVGARAEAVALLNRLVASLASPEGEVRGHEHVIAELKVVGSEVADEVQSAVIGRGVPEVILHSIIRLVHLEGRHQRHVSALLEHKLLDLVSIMLRDEHAWDSNSIAVPVVNHDHILDVLILLIDDDGKPASGVLDVPHLVHEGAASSLNQHYRARIGVWVVAAIDLDLEIRAAVQVVLVYPNITNDGVAVRSDAEVGN